MDDKVLQNAAIEPPEKLFIVEFIKFGSIKRPACRLKRKVGAKTRTGATRIIKAFYPRSGNHLATEVSAALGTS